LAEVLQDLEAEVVIQGMEEAHHLLLYQQLVEALVLPGMRPQQFLGVQEAEEFKINLRVDLVHQDKVILEETLTSEM
jgi:hypothetical protein